MLRRVSKDAFLRASAERLVRRVPPVGLLENHASRPYPIIGPLTQECSDRRQVALSKLPMFPEGTHFVRLLHAFILITPKIRICSYTIHLCAEKKKKKKTNFKENENKHAV